MTIYSKITIGGSEVLDSYEYSVNKSIGENNQSSSFEASLENFAGRNKDNYVVGDDVIVYADLVDPPTTKIFTGILEDRKFEGEESTDKISLAGRDYSARLMDRTVEPEVYSNLLAGSIVKDIIAKYVNDLTVTHVNDSPTTINRITFNQMPVFDAIKKLADMSNYTFYVDEDKDLHFEEKAGSSSGYTFDNTNLVRSDFKEQRDGLFNQIWVYGDRYLDGYRETLTGDGTGSIFTLTYNPHNTSVTVDGTLKQPGGVYEMTYSVGSMVKYLVRYDSKQVIFTSGTAQGDNIPGLGKSVVITYDRDLPIVKVGDNEISKAKYGTRVKVIQDKSIKDPKTAEQILLSEMDKYGDPAKEGKLQINGIVNVIPGRTCIVDIPSQGINAEYDILEANYNFNKENNLNNQVLDIKVNRKIPDITDTMKDILLQLKKLQSADMTESDLITRYQYTAGSEGMRHSGCKIYTSSITGSCLLCYWNGGSIGMCGTLASGIYQKGLAGAPNGEAYTPLTVLWSGGYV